MVIYFISPGTDKASHTPLQIFIIAFWLFGIYQLLISKKIKAYYLAIRTGIVADESLLDPIISPENTARINKVLGFIADAAIVVIALLVFSMFFLLPLVS